MGGRGAAEDDDFRRTVCYSQISSTKRMNKRTQTARASISRRMKGDVPVYWASVTVSLTLKAPRLVAPTTVLFSATGDLLLVYYLFMLRPW